MRTNALDSDPEVRAIAVHVGIEPAANPIAMDGDDQAPLALPGAIDPADDGVDQSCTGAAEKDSLAAVVTTDEHASMPLPKEASTPVDTATFRAARALGVDHDEAERTRRRRRLVISVVASCAIVIAVPLGFHLLARLAWSNVNKDIAVLQQHMRNSRCCMVFGQACAEFEGERTALTDRFTGLQHGWRVELSGALGARIGRKNLDFWTPPTPTDFADMLACQNPPPPPPPLPPRPRPPASVCTSRSASNVSRSCMSACDPTCNLNRGALRCFPAGLNWTGDDDDGGMFSPSFRDAGWVNTDGLPEAMQKRIAELDACLQRCCADVPYDRPEQNDADTGYEVAKATGTLVLDVLPKSSWPRLTYPAGGKTVILEFEVAAPPAHVIAAYAKQLRAKGVDFTRVADGLQSDTARVWVQGTSLRSQVSIAWRRPR